MPNTPPSMKPSARCTCPHPARKPAAPSGARRSKPAPTPPTAKPNPRRCPKRHFTTNPNPQENQAMAKTKPTPAAKKPAKGPTIKALNDAVYPAFDEAGRRVAEGSNEVKLVVQEAAHEVQ